MNDPEVWSVDPVTGRWIVDPTSKCDAGLRAAATVLGIAAILFGWLMFAVLVSM